ncbi:hypothetical protein Tco_0449870 [Tanacetum coccineum]
MSFTNGLKAMDDRLGEIDEHIYKMGGEVEELTAVMSWMSKQYDQFYGEFRSMRLEQESPQMYLTAPFTAPTNPFSLFDNPGDVPCISHHRENAMDEE